MKTLIMGVIVTLGSATAALSKGIPGTATVVPEIDAVAGVAALAVVGAAVALIRERTKR